MSDEAMTGAEFRICRESLGLTAEWLSQRFGVHLRTVRRWDHGHAAVSAGIAAQMRELARQTDDFIDEVLEAVEDDEDPQLVTYPSDEVYLQEHPDATWPAAWHRAAMGRVMEADPRVRVRFIGAGSDGG